MWDGRDLAALVVPTAGKLIVTGDRYEPFRLAGPDGAAVEPVTAFFRELLAAGCSEATVRSYGMDLLRWFRFIWAAGLAWDQVTQSDARDFSRWLRAGRGGRGYAPAVRAHSETVLRGFYGYHLDAGTGPIVNPFPLDRSRRQARAGAHHNPMEPHRSQRTGRYRPRVPSRVPRAIPDEEFNEIFARLPSHRDRALVAFYVSTGARASELLSATAGGADPGRQLVTVTRKGTGELQQLPASTDAFVWLRLYQAEMDGLIPAGRGQPLWWTLRRPVRPLTYHAVHRMFERACGKAGLGGDAARAAAHRRLPDGRGSGSAADRRAGRPRPPAAGHHAGLPDAARGGRDPPGAGPPRRAGAPGPAAGRAAAGGRVPAGDAAGAVRDGELVTARLQEARAAATPAPAQLFRQTRRAAWAAARAAFPPRPAAAGLAGHPDGPGPGAGHAAPGTVHRR